jgi:hypothetical protein
MPRINLDEFTQAYMDAAFWSSTIDPYGTCPQCGKDERILCRWDKDQNPVCEECSDKEPNYEPTADENYSIADLAPEAFAKMVEDCRVFQSNNEHLFTEDNCPRVPGECSVTEYAGHDFWLSRNNHGCGFWDGDWKDDIGNLLDKAAEAFGECNLYVGDDGRIYLS